MPRVVKSAVRVLEVLELFDRLQREASVGEVARELGYPVSSTSMLLGSLLERGYLRHGPDQRTYFPTPRVTLLGAWIEPQLTPHAEVKTAPFWLSLSKPLQARRGRGTSTSLS